MEGTIFNCPEGTVGWSLWLCQPCLCRTGTRWSILHVHHVDWTVVGRRVWWWRKKFINSVALCASAFIWPIIMHNGGRRVNLGKNGGVRWRLRKELLISIIDSLVVARGDRPAASRSHFYNQNGIIFCLLLWNERAWVVSFSISKLSLLNLIVVPQSHRPAVCGYHCRGDQTGHCLVGSRKWEAHHLQLPWWMGKCSTLMWLVSSSETDDLISSDAACAGPDCAYHRPTRMTRASDGYGALPALLPPRRASSLSLCDGLQWPIWIQIWFSQRTWFDLSQQHGGCRQRREVGGYLDTRVWNWVKGWPVTQYEQYTNSNYDTATGMLL